MKSLFTVLAVLLFSLSARSISGDNGTVRLPASIHSNHTRYAILGNDWGSTAFIPFLLALSAGIEVLGLASNTANTWVEQTTLHGVSLASISKRMKCLNEDLARHSRERKPVLHSSNQGRDLPLDTNVSRFQLWQQLWGSLEWQGVFAPQNLTKQSLGNDPTGDDPTQISKSAFTEGYPNTTALEGYSAAQFMVEQVHKYPGQVSIYSAVTIHQKHAESQLLLANPFSRAH